MPLNLRNPATVELVVRALLKHNMDAEAALKELLPDAKPHAISELIEEISESAVVQDAVERSLQPLGLDEGAKNKYVEVLWRWVFGPDRDKAQTAARLLGRAFLPTEGSPEKTEPLLVTDAQDGLKRMGVTTTDDSDTEHPNVSTVPEKVM